MKKPIPILSFVLLCLAACTPFSSKPTVSSGTTPVLVGDCLITPHAYQNQDNTTPMGVLVSVPGTDGLSLLWQDGTPLGTYPAGSWLPRTNTHLAGPLSDGTDAVPLVFLGSAENGRVQLKTALGSQVTTLKEFPPNVTVTGLIGIPELSVLAYSTLETAQDGSTLRSQVFLGDTQTIATASPILTVESDASRVTLPVAIHRDVNHTPDGLWYTSSLWGIGGDSLSDPRSGLFYLDLATGKSAEFLSLGCAFSDLSSMQDWATWSAAGVLYAADLHTGKTVSFPRLAGDERGPAHAFIGPGDGYLAWLEGKGSEWDGTLETTLRIGSLEGVLLGEYPLATFAAAAGLGDGSAILPLGWMASENYSVVLAVYNASSGRAALVGLDANTGKISVLSAVSEGGFAGFAYP